MKQKLLLLFLCMCIVGSLTAQTELLTNGSFETGDLGDWILEEANATTAQASGSCRRNWTIDPDSSNTCCCVEDINPTDGSFGAFTSFDSTEINTQWIIEQAVTLPSTITTANVSFDFGANFDFGLGAPVTIPRELLVQILSADGSEIITEVFSDEFIGDGLLSINYSQNIDITSSLNGQEDNDVILRFTAIIPESNAGPSKAFIDNVSFIVDDTLGLNDEVTNNEIIVYPNPSNGTFTINYLGASPLEKGYIYDISGKRVSQINFTEFNGSQLIQTNLSTGLYLIKIHSASGIQTSQLIIR